MENIITNLASPPILEIHSAEDPVNIIEIYRNEYERSGKPNKYEDSHKFK